MRVCVCKYEYECVWVDVGVKGVERRGSIKAEFLQRGFTNWCQRGGGGFGSIVHRFQ